ncbi:MAG: hypothetical protein WDM76_03960 [Limisphaerales bacterium]
MFVRLGHVLMIVALLAATGGHWAALQTVAWTTMLAENLHSGSVSDALVKTFDGRHPCPLCKAITAGKESEKKSEFTPQLKKLEYPPAPEKVVLIAPAEFQILPTIQFSAEALTHQPPTPSAPFRLIPSAWFRALS